MLSTVCNYCGTDTSMGSCKNCGAPAKKSSTASNNELAISKDPIEEFLDFVGYYAPLREGALYNFFVWPLVVMVVSLVYAIKIIISKKDWTEDRWRVYTLLFLFAPLGLWGVYSSRTIPGTEKIVVYVFTVCLVTIYSIFGK
jgi:hypothetical protein